MLRFMSQPASTELAVLTTLLAFSRSKRQRTLAELVRRAERAGAAPNDVGRDLASLARQSLVQRAPDGMPRLSLAGLAVAVAVAATRARPRRASIVARPRISRPQTESRVQRRRAA